MGCNETYKDVRLAELELENTRLRSIVDSLESIKSPFQIVNDGLSKDFDQLEEVSSINADDIRRSLQSSNEPTLLKDFNQGVAILNGLINHADSLFELVVKESGGYNEFDRILNKKNKAAGTRILIDQGLGNEFKLMCDKVALEIESIIMRHKLDVNVSSLFIRRSDHHLKYDKSYAQYIFSEMPVAALEPIFMKFKNDFINAQASFINGFREIVE